MRAIKVLIFIFFLTFSAHAFGKSNDYYKHTLAHVLTQCNSECQKKVFEQEVHQGFFVLMDAVLNQLSFELSQKIKKSYD
mgnify:FL=1